VRKISVTAALAAMLLAGGANPALAAEQAPAKAGQPVKPSYTTADTEIGTLMDDKSAWAVVIKHIPELNNNEQMEMARGLTLRVIQSYAAEQITDARLAAIDAEFAALNKK
jgi:hypothetical protein